MTNLEKERNEFMRNVTAQVWRRLEEDGHVFTFGEIKEHFLEMMKSDIVQDKVANIFLERC